MRVQHLLEDDAEPLLTTILRKALEKGKEVRVYYKGNGGKVKDIEWDPPAKTAKIGRDSPEVEKGNGATSFKLKDGNWVVIGDHNIDKLKTSTRTNKDGSEVITAKAPPIVEGMMDGRDWIDARWAEFKKIVTDAGWMISNKPSYGLENGYFGGTFRASAAAKRSLLNLTEQRHLIMKMLARRFIKLASEGLNVVVSPNAIGGNGGASSSRRLNVRPETQIVLIIDALEDGMYIKMDGSAFDAYWTVSVPKHIVDHTTDAFAKALTKARHEDE